ncbi:hypothetical protein L345_09741, partial [Ophiophagus hannah]
MEFLDSVAAGWENNLIPQENLSVSNKNDRKYNTRPEIQHRSPKLGLKIEEEKNQLQNTMITIKAECKSEIFFSNRPESKTSCNSEEEKNSHFGNALEPEIHIGTVYLQRAQRSASVVQAILIKTHSSFQLLLCFSKKLESLELKLTFGLSSFIFGCNYYIAPDQEPPSSNSLPKYARDKEGCCVISCDKVVMAEMFRAGCCKIKHINHCNMNTHDLRRGTEKQSSLGQKMLSQVMVRLLEPAGAALIQLMEQDSFQKFPTELLLGVFLALQLRGHQVASPVLEERDTISLQEFRALVNNPHEQHPMSGKEKPLLFSERTPWKGQEEDSY